MTKDSMFCACIFHGNSMNNLLSYCGLVDVRRSASEKDLPVLGIYNFEGGLLLPERECHHHLHKNYLVTTENS